jgi:hypothetical protein
MPIIVKDFLKVFEENTMIKCHINSKYTIISHDFFALKNKKIQKELIKILKNIYYKIIIHDFF